jgi:long-subunit acyl-CoA synthetase (AMP-forming)
MQVVDTRTKRVLGPNENGAILVKAVTMMVGYWKNPSATQKALHEGVWYKTGQ